MTAPVDDVLADLRAEYAQISALLDGLTDADWRSPSAAPGWSVADTVFHLAVTEEGVPTSLSLGAGGWTTRERPLDDVIEDGMVENTASPLQVFARWSAACDASLSALATADSDVAVQWAAAPLKPRTLATTRIAEHWAHTLDIAVPLGLEYEDTDRLRHVAWLGHATLPYAMRLAGFAEVPIRAVLTAPSGAVYEFGPPGAEANVSGGMGAFCRVGARRLAVEESGLVTSSREATDALSVLRNYAA